MYQGNLKRTDASRAPDPNSRSWFEINPNREQPSPEEADCSSVPGAATHLILEPLLAFAWVIVKKQVRCASVPSSLEPLAKF